MNEMDYSNRRILVVGGSSGIGNGIAQAFRERGGHVHVWGTRASAGEYDGERGSDLTGLGYTSVDVGNPDAIAETPPPFEKGLDVLILCQGTVAYNRKEFERDGWNRVMSVNLDSLLFCAEKFRSDLSEAGGSLIIVSSVSAYRGNIGNPGYAASKAGAVNLTMSLGQAYASEGIRVNGLAPGLVETKLTEVTTKHPKRRELALQQIPMGRLGTPADMAGAALFLASPLASYICGQTLLVDGGLSL